MLFSYDECIQMFGSDYQIKKAIKSGKLFRMEKGLYSDQDFVPELSIISKKYPNGIFTLNSAFYYHGLSNQKPEQYHLQTSRGAAKIRDVRVKQTFDNSKNYEVGKIKFIYESTEINIYSKERLFIELIRNQSKFSFDDYKKLINEYRKIVDPLDVDLIKKYAFQFPKTNLVLKALDLEVL